MVRIDARWVLVWVLAGTLVVWAGIASAQPGATEPRPWAVGVAEAEQQRAREIADAGNLEFVESRCVEALDRYREALGHWDSPAIRFNIAVCLIKLGKLVEARENLERSMAYGATALDPERFNQATTYRKLLDAQLTRVTVTCDDDGAEVTLDGKRLFTGPGSAIAYVTPGTHRVVVTRPGRFEVTSRMFSALAGQPTTLEVEALPLPLPPPTLGMGIRGGYTPQYRTPNTHDGSYNATSALLRPGRGTARPFAPAPLAPAPSVAPAQSLSSSWITARPDGGHWLRAPVLPSSLAARATASSSSRAAAARSSGATSSSSSSSSSNTSTSGSTARSVSTFRSTPATHEAPSSSANRR